MNSKERRIIALILLAIAFMVSVDVFTDSREGVVGWHILVEVLMGIASLIGAFYVLKGSFLLKHQLDQERKDFSEFKQEADKWRQESKKHSQGLSQAIDYQLTKWHLSTAEKEVAFLLLKGLSLKEIASIRNTSEKTARAQSLAIYAKSGLSGRSELSAFFLEDLLLPTSER